MKKALFIFAICILCISISGCKGKSSLSDYDRIHTRLTEMTGYSANCEITYYTDKSEDRLVIEQSADNTGKYKIKGVEPKETSGSTILFDGNMIWLYNPSVKSKVQVSATEKDRRKELILFTFLKNETMAGEEPTTAASSQPEQKYIVFESTIPGNDENYASEKLFMDEKSGDPAKLIIYNSKGDEYLTEVFSDFVYNPDFDQNTFAIAEELKDKVN